MTLRVPILNHQQSSNSNYKILEFVRKFKIFSFSRVLRIRFPFGFSSRMVFLLWCVCGGLLQHFFECNILDILLQTNYEKAVDTAQDILDRSLTVIYPPESGSTLEVLKNSPSAATRKLALITVVPKVIFYFVEIFPLLILNLPKRIGMTMIRWFKMLWFMVLLLLNVASCMIMS